MKAFVFNLFLLSASVEACMSDAACAGGEVTMCCYMNTCVPSSNVGCSGKRLQFHSHFAALKTKQERDAFASELLDKSANAYKCQNDGIHCLDFVTEVVKEPGALSKLDGFSEFVEM